VSDPMSGFFAIRREIVTAEALKPLGYKILLELAVRCRPRTVARFLALLELYRDRVVALDQDEALGPLTVRWTGHEREPTVSDEFDRPVAPPEPGATGAD
ncbi:segregation/condensation protein A, partial [Streptomyces calidiresistens]|uniref:segregation/condensation protein A n=1 Tax=Streptomyces calidiresistens TaxID=1485586 RepID=UPI001887C805